MEGSLNVVDFADYYSTNEAAAVIIKDVFSIEFSEEEASVVVTCPSAQLLSMRLPASLCGKVYKEVTYLYKLSDDTIPCSPRCNCTCFCLLFQNMSISMLLVYLTFYRVTSTQCNPHKC